MKDLKRVKDLIIATIDMASVMKQYGIQFTFDPQKAVEVQFRCPFHGADKKPSARYYRPTQSAYCWKCHKSWDVISFVMDKEGFSFVDAIRYIVNRYNVNISSIPDDPDIREKKQPKPAESSVTLLAIERKLQELRGKLIFEKYRAFCTAVIMARFAVSQGTNSVDMIKKIESKLEKIYQENLING